VGIQAGALHVERSGDVTHARGGVATLAEQGGCDVVDLAPAGGLDHRGWVS
jgi:hypothetical protein